MPIAELNTPPIQEPILQVDLFPSPVDQPMLAGLKVTRPWAQFLEYIAQKVAAVSSGSTSVVAYLTTHTLTANYAVASPATPADNDIFTLILTEDATGGWQITIGAGFSNFTVNDISTAPNKKTTLQFVGSGGSWWLTSILIR